MQPAPEQAVSVVKYEMNIIFYLGFDLSFLIFIRTNFYGRPHNT